MFSNKMKTHIFIIFCLSSLNGCYNLRQFFNGRQQGGNLGVPGGLDHHGLDVEFIADANKYERWFTQNLDHFNPSDERTWQQVIIWILFVGTLIQ